MSNKNGTAPRAAARAGADFDRVAVDQPVRLAWKDPEDGETLWVELWGSPAFVAELVDQGFALCDEPEGADVLRVSIHERTPTEH